MPLPNAALRLLFRPRVLHSLPGRLRIGLPFLKKAAQTDRDLIQTIAALLRVPDEIHAVEANQITGTVLIAYDADRASEKDVIGFLKGLFEIYLRNRATLDALPADRWPETEARLAALVRGALQHRLAVDTNIQVTDTILLPE